MRTDALIAALQGRAAGGDVVPEGIAALEVAAGLVGRAFAGASVVGDRFNLLTPPMMEMIGALIDTPWRNRLFAG